MRLLTVSKYAWLGFARRVLKHIIHFPLLGLLLVAALILMVVGLSSLYDQYQSLLLSSPADTRSVMYRYVIATVMPIIFLIFSLFVWRFQEPSVDRSTLVAAPIRYSQLWLGSNSVVLGLLLCGQTAVAFVFLLAASQIAFPGSIFPYLLSLFWAVGFVVRAMALAMCSWAMTRFARVHWRISGVLLVLLDIGLPILIIACLGAPLVMPTSFATTDPAVWFLTKALEEPSFIHWTAAFLALCLPLCLFIGLGVAFLDRTPEQTPIVTHKSFLSARFTFGVPFCLCLASELKRMLREKTLVLMHVFFGAVLMLYVQVMAYNMPQVLPMLWPVVGFLIPYLAVSFPIVVLHNDISADWVFRSAKLSRIRYLILKFVSVTCAVLFITFLFLLGTNPQPSFFPLQDFGVLLCRTLGMTGLAFTMGGIFRQLVKDMATQVLITFVLFALGAGIDYLLSTSVSSYIDVLPANLFWLGFFFVAPWIVLFWEKHQDNKSNWTYVDL